MATDPEVFRQYLTAILANIGSMGVGSIMGYASPAGAYLTNNSTDKNDLYITSSENSWFSSLSNLGASIGCILAGFCLRYFGRRGTILYSSIIPTIGWILLISAPNYLLLVTGRVITGLYCGIHTVAASTFIGEFSSSHIRGILGTFLQIFVFSGILLTYVFGGIFNSFRYNGAICAILPCICSISILFVKESPLYLISNGKELEAEESLKFYRGENYSSIVKEMKALKDSIEESRKNKANLRDLLRRPNLKPFSVVLCLMIFQQTTGFMAVISNLALIFQDPKMSADTSSIIAAVVNVASSLICSSFVEKAGRKILLIISGAIMAVSLAMMGVFFYLMEYHNSLSNSITWLPLLAVIIYLIGFSAGYGVLPWVLLGEIFAPEVKEMASSISAAIVWGCAFLLSLLFKVLQDMLHPFGVYFLFSGFCVLSVFYTLTSVYETKGKTLQEINDYYSGNENRSDEVMTLNSDTKDVA
ncbi:Facilitated trehalose transporter Tret1 [Armadillidium nasatum]|uniref:Facilitated trehalose transporter Tret1 n=1 Tax=Armadillidium nasatum TaxID=96803 RepID=A0A5N5STH7_9CRUS|nr:Facilitated trehalose transporter Tret1 [Armadillidium nasatum]